MPLIIYVAYVLGGVVACCADPTWFLAARVHASEGWIRAKRAAYNLDGECFVYI